MELYNGNGDSLIGILNNCIDAKVTEIRNSDFELRIIYPIMTTTDNENINNNLTKGNLIKCKANDELDNQFFRIYNVRKMMNNRIEILARHIFFDLRYDFITNLKIDKQSCEYSLNQLFRNSRFSKDFKGISDIQMAGNFNQVENNLLNAIVGSKGSIIDTFGTGAELLRNNKTVTVLNKRGHDNGVIIEYGKNLTGITVEEDDTDLITSIYPVARYTPEGGEEITVTLQNKYVDSANISKFSHPFIQKIDFTDKLKQGEIPTEQKLVELSNKYFKDTQCDFPRRNYSISFIPLSKCVGYESVNDKITLCDTITVRDYRYNIDTKAKVIKVVFDVLKNRYDSMEVGNPRDSLNDLVGESNKGEQGEQGPQGPPGADGNIGDFPDTLPPVPTLNLTVYGFSTIEINWTFENKVYYNYELYASKIKDFNPTSFDLIFEGQVSSYLFQAKPSETWYFKVRGVNSYGKATEFSEQKMAETKKIEDLSNYVDNMAIGDALIGTLSFDRGWVGKLTGNWIDARQLTVTDGNEKRTLDIDSFGNVSLDVTSLNIKSKSVETSLTENANKIKAVEQKTTDSAIINTVSATVNQAKNEAINSSNASTDNKLNNYTTQKQFTEFKQSSENFQLKIENRGMNNLVVNGDFSNDTSLYSTWNSNIELISKFGCRVKSSSNAPFGIITAPLDLKQGKYTITLDIGSYYNVASIDYVYIIGTPSGNENCRVNMPLVNPSSIEQHRQHFTITVSRDLNNVKILIGTTNSNSSGFTINNIMMTAGDNMPTPFNPSSKELYTSNFKFDLNGLRADFEDGSYTKMGREGFSYYTSGMKNPYKYINFTAKISTVRNGSWTKITLPICFGGKKINSDFVVQTWAGAVDSNAFANKQKDAIRNLFIEIGGWNSTTRELTLRPCMQKIGIATMTHWGWDANTTTSGNTIGEGAIDIIVLAQM